VSSLIKGQNQKSILKNEESKYINESEIVQSPGSGQSKRNQGKVEIESLKVRRQSMTYRRSCAESTMRSSKFRKRSSSCPDIYKNSMLDEEEEDETFYTSMMDSFKECLSLHYVTVPFVMFCISNFLLYFWYDVPYVYSIEYAENNLNIPNTKSTQILSIIGILNTVGEVAVGWLSDQKYISSIGLYAVCMLICGAATAIIPFVTSYPVILALSAAYGFCISANYSLTSPILVDLVSIQQFSAAYGLLLACQGIGNLVGPPFAGWLYDFSSEWYLTFGLCGIFIAFSGISLLIIPTIMLIKRSLKLAHNKQNLECNVSNETDVKITNFPIDV